MARDLATPKNFEFTRMDTVFPGYNSANDPTKIDPSIMVGGSLNVYKKINGNIANRPGKKLYSPADTTSAPVTSEYVWNKGSKDYIFQVANSKLQFLYNNTWYDLLTGLTTTRWVFDKWFSQAENNGYLVGVNGAGIYTWSGGTATVGSTNTTSINLAGGSGLTGTTTITGTAITKVIPYINPFSGASFGGTLWGATNPSNGETLIFGVQGVSGITITFVSVIGAAAGNVLIGATLADTMSNLRGLLNSPGTTSATQVALSGPNQTAIGNISFGTVGGAIKVSGTNTWAQEGFTWVPSGGFFNLPTVIINGTSYTYSGPSAYTTVMSGSGMSVAGISPGDFVYQATNTYAGIIGISNNFLPDFCKTIDNQLYYGNYNSQNCYVSKSTDPYDATPSSPAVQGSANAITFDGNLNGITVKNGKPYMSIGGNKWGIVNYTFVNPTGVSTTTYRTTTVEYTPTSAGSGAYAHEFIDQVGDSITYLSQDQQVRQFGAFNTSFTSNNYPSLSQEIYTELQAETFSNSTYTGNLRCIGDYIYLTSPISGLTYLYQARQAVNSNNQVVVERLWHAPMTWNLCRVDVINNTVLGFSNSNPQIYQLWDTGIYYDEDPSGDTFAYTSTLKFAYDGQKRRQGLWSFDKVFTEGYIEPETTLGLTIKYNYNGTEDILSQDVNSGDNPATFFTIDPSSLGDESLGDSSFGMGGDDSDSDLYKFKVINQFSLVNCFEWQLEYESTESGSQWEILSKGTNARVEDEQAATFIINKQ